MDTLMLDVDEASSASSARDGRPSGEHDERARFESEREAVLALESLHTGSSASPGDEREEIEPGTATVTATATATIVTPAWLEEYFRDMKEQLRTDNHGKPPFLPSMAEYERLYNAFRRAVYEDGAFAPSESVVLELQDHFYGGLYDRCGIKKPRTQLWLRCWLAYHTVLTHATTFCSAQEQIALENKLCRCYFAAFRCLVEPLTLLCGQALENLSIQQVSDCLHNSGATELSDAMRRLIGAILRSTFKKPLTGVQISEMYHRVVAQIDNAAASPSGRAIKTCADDDGPTRAMARDRPTRSASAPLSDIVVAVGTGSLADPILLDDGDCDGDDPRIGDDRPDGKDDSHEDEDDGDEAGDEDEDYDGERRVAARVQRRETRPLQRFVGLCRRLDVLYKNAGQVRCHHARSFGDVFT